MSLFLLTLK